MQDELAIVVICGLTALASVLSLAYHTAIQEERTISSRARLRYLFISFPIFLLLAKIVSYLTSNDPTSFAIAIILLTIVYALLQYLSIGWTTVLFSWAIWLPGTAAIVVYFRTMLASVTSFIDGSTSIQGSDQATMTAITTISTGLVYPLLLVFLGAIAFFGVETTVLWRQGHYNTRSKRMITSAMGLGLVVFVFMIIRGVVNPLSTVLIKLLSS
jgi:hypothetical protein